MTSANNTSSTSTRSDLICVITWETCRNWTAWWTGVLTLQQWNNLMNKINTNLTTCTHNYWVRTFGDEEGGTIVTLQGTINARPKTFQCTGLKMKETVWLPTGTALQTIFQVIKENNKSTFTKRNSILEGKCWQYWKIKCKDIQKNLSNSK